MYDGLSMVFTRLAVTAYELVDGMPNGKNILIIGTQTPAV